MHTGGISAASRHLPQASGIYNDQQHSSSSSPTSPFMHKNNTGPGSTASSNTMRQRKRERPRPMGSTLLTDAENNQLFEMLGPDRISLAAGVAQLLSSSPIEAPNAGGVQWRKWHLGVASLVKDYGQKCYSIGIYDVFNGEQLWIQTLYKDFRATNYPSCPRFISFEGDHCVFALSFSDQSEADNFKDHLQKRSEHEQKSNQREQRMNSGGGYQHQNYALQGRTQQKQPTNAVSAPFSTGMHARHTPNQSPISGGITAAGTVPHFGNSNNSMHHMTLSSSPSVNRAQQLKSAKSKENKKGKKSDKRPKHRKEDISNPTDFKHLAHVGWDQDGGFSRQVYNHEPLDESVRDLLRAAGQNPDQFDNPEDIKFVYDFLEGQGIDRQNLQNSAFPSHNYPYQQTSNSLAANYSQRSALMEHHQVPPQVPPLAPSTCTRRDISTPQLSTTMHHGAKQPPPPRPPPVMNASAGHGRPLPQPPPHISAHQKPVVQTGFYTHSSGAGTVSMQNGGHRHLPPTPSSHAHILLDGNQHTNGGPPPPPPTSNHRPPPPPVPATLSSSINNSGNIAPLSNNVPPPPPPPPPQLLQGPQPTSTANGSAPKPPPPPPMKVPSGGADTRTNLLAQIQAGPKLKPVGAPSTDKQPVPTNPPTTRDNMMQQIKQGTQLKHVDANDAENRKSVTAIQDLGGIAGALARALEERRKNMMNSEDSDETSEENENEWED